MIRVRLGKLSDATRATEMISEHVKSCANWFPEPTLDRVERLIALSEAGHNVLTICAERDGELIGFGCAAICQYLWADAMQGQIMVVCVRPKHRGGSAFIRMMKVIEQWLGETGCVQASFTCSTGHDDEKTARMLAKIGWKTSGIDTVKEFRHVA